MATAHAAGLVHRDIKPANLWLEEGTGRVKILDFGLARGDQGEQLTGSGGFCGTPGYSAPEQMDGAAPAPAADLFSLGCVLYRMLTGTAAFSGPNLSAVLLSVARCDPVSPADRDPSLPSAVVDLTLRLLQRDPRARPATASALIEDITHLQKALSAGVPGRSGEPSRTASAAPLAESATKTQPLPASKRVRPWAMALAGVAACVLLGTAVWFATRGGSPTSETPPPEPLKGDVDLLVWKKTGEGPIESRQGQRLSLPGVLPLEEGDYMRVEVTLNRPAYVYVIWLDAAGAAVPSYPWSENRWDPRPAEQARQTVHLPATDDYRGAPLTGGPSGVEVMLLLVRETPLPAGAEVELQAVFAKGWQATKVREAAPFAAWLENGAMVKDETRGAIVSEKAKPLVNPLLQTQQLLKRDLQTWFTYSRAVCYGFKGD